MKTKIIRCANCKKVCEINSDSEIGSTFECPACKATLKILSMEPPKSAKTNSKTK